jgi:hypothetical protein
MDGYDFAISMAEGGEKFYRLLDGRVDALQRILKGFLVRDPQGDRREPEGVFLKPKTFAESFPGC